MNNNTQKRLPILWLLGFGLFTLFGLLTLLSVPGILDRGDLKETRQEFAIFLEQALADPIWSSLNDLQVRNELRHNLKVAAGQLDTYLPIYEKYILDWKGRDFFINLILGLLLTAAGITGLRRKPLAVPLTAGTLSLATLWAAVVIVRCDGAATDLIESGFTSLQTFSLLRPVSYWSLALITLLHAAIAYDVWKRRHLLVAGVDQNKNE